MKRMGGNGKLEAAIIRAKDEILRNNGAFWRSDLNKVISWSHSPQFNSELLTPSL